MIWANNIMDVVFVAIAVVISITLHELAHGYVALWNGDPTAKVNGRLTPNPVAHFDLIGFIMLLSVGFGYAKPVPVNPYNFRHQKRGIFTVAIAGVVVNLILAFLSFGLMVLLSWIGSKFFYGQQAYYVFDGFSDFFFYMVMINLNLFFFNLIPIYPLDGFRVVEAFTRFTNPIAKFLRDYGLYILIGLVGLGFVADIFVRFGAPYYFRYFDVLGMYIQTMRGFVSQGFGMFWGLIFR